jgi:hypothetical protein
MKNIHILPTDKPSRLILQGSELVLSKYMEVNEGFSEFNQNIYITSDVEIKEGDWILNPTNEVQNCIGLEKGIGTDNICWVKVKETTTLQQILNSQKLIITTDKDLIKDGVQAISNEFLQWFVQNPSCEEVEIESWQTKGDWDLDYKIIIPNEEPKYPIGGYAPGYYGCTCVTCKTEFMGDKRAVQCEPCAIEMTKEEPKQETLEEAAERWNEKQTKLEFGKPHNAPNRIKAFIAGAKLQQERMYSEEEVYNILVQHTIELFKGQPCTLDEFFEQFKKK